jgi:hypothetical protein
MNRGVESESQSEREKKMSDDICHADAGAS